MERPNQELVDSVAYNSFLQFGTAKAISLIGEALAKYDPDEWQLVRSALRQLRDFGFTESDRKNFLFMTARAVPTVENLLKSDGIDLGDDASLLEDIRSLLNFVPNVFETKSLYPWLNAISEACGVTAVAVLSVLAAGQGTHLRQHDIRGNNVAPMVASADTPAEEEANEEDDDGKVRPVEIATSLSADTATPNADLGAKAFSKSSLDGAIDGDDYSGEKISFKDFARKAFEALENGTFKFGSFFMDSEYLFGKKIIRSNRALAEKKRKDLDKGKFKNHKEMSDIDLIDAIGSVINEPLSDSDPRNDRSYLMDLYSDSGNIGNCVARTKAALDLVDRYRSELLKNVYVQKSHEHVEPVLLLNGKAYAFGGEMVELGAKNLMGTLFYTPEQYVRSFLGDKPSRDQVVGQTESLLKKLGLSPGDLYKNNGWPKEDSKPYEQLMFELDSFGMSLNSIQGINEEEGKTEGGGDPDVKNYFSVQEAIRPLASPNEIIEQISQLTYITGLFVKAPLIPPEGIRKLQELPQLDTLALNLENFVNSSPMLLSEDGGEHHYVAGEDPRLVKEANSLLVEVLPRLDSVSNLSLHNLRHLPKSLADALASMNGLESFSLPNVETFPDDFLEKIAKKGVVSTITLGSEAPGKDFSFEKLKPFAEKGILGNIHFFLHVGDSGNVDISGIKRAFEYQDSLSQGRKAPVNLTLRADEISDDLIDQLEGLVKGRLILTSKIISRKHGIDSYSFARVPSQYFKVGLHATNEQIKRLYDIFGKSQSQSLFSWQFVIANGLFIYDNVDPRLVNKAVRDYLVNMPKIGTDNPKSFKDAKGRPLSSVVKMAMIDADDGPYSTPDGRIVHSLKILKKIAPTSFAKWKAEEQSGERDVVEEYEQYQRLKKFYGSAEEGGRYFRLMWF